MPKFIEIRENVVIQKMIEFPINVAAEILATYCNNCGQCILSIPDHDPCPFMGIHCVNITADMWKEYINENEKDKDNG